MSVLVPKLGAPTMRFPLEILLRHRRTPLRPI
jgi:hypothetical protein